MALLKQLAMISASTFAVFGGAVPASAEILTADCDGMGPWATYTFDTALDEQYVEGVGDADFSMDEAEILLQGDFGEYRFDLKTGLLFHNGNPTGLSCLYSSSENEG